jgi:hypothetical protein
MEKIQNILAIIYFGALHLSLIFDRYSADIMLRCC